jgi:hypothetical protein
LDDKLKDKIEHEVLRLNKLFDSGKPLEKKSPMIYNGIKKYLKIPSKQMKKEQYYLEKKIRKS